MTTMFDLLAKAGIKQTKCDGDYSVEVEAEFVREPSFVNKVENWDIKNDGSLRGFGYEFVTRVPRSLKTAIANIDNLLKQDYFQGSYSPSHRTSTHVHVNIQNWTMDDLIKVLMVYYLCEPLLTRWGGNQREGNLFCLRLCDAERGIEAVKFIIDERWTNLSRNFDLFKYSALNVASVVRLGTIEFRQMRGTNDAEILSRWLNKIDFLIKFAKAFRTHESIMEEYIRDPVSFINRATDNINPVNSVFDIDFNYSLCFEILDYMMTKPERVAKLMSKKSKQKEYNFKINDDILE